MVDEVLFVNESYTFFIPKNNKPKGAGHVPLTADYSIAVDRRYIPLGSCSLKSCQIAEGITDCYLRIGPTGEWDTGASQCILEEAGGSVLHVDTNKPLVYNKENLLNPFFIANGNVEA